MIDNLPPALGSLFMIGIPGTRLDESTIDLIQKDGVHNFILFKRNVESREQLKELCASLSKTCLASNLPKPLISIDQEGGSVTRLPPPFTQFPDQRQLAEAGNCEELLGEYARTCAKELKEVGVNMNLAPVLDICPSGQGYFMEKRCLGADPDLVSHLGVLVVAEMQKGGVAACVKHFPGLGRAVLDPHHELPFVASSRESLLASDLIPFEAACAADVASFMTSHAIYEQLDHKRPATLSRPVLQGILRERIGYEGLVITDDLEMGAIENTEHGENPALGSFLAGADLMLICQDHDKVRKALGAFEKAWKDGVFEMESVSLALLRQSKVREQYAD